MTAFDACICPASGQPFVCPRWNRTMGPELQEICAGMRERDKRATYVRLWEEGATGIVAAGVHPDEHRFVVARYARGRIELETADRVSRTYGLTVWPAGERLAEWLLDTPGAVEGRVLDLGAGTGIVGIAAGLAGAVQVDLADAVPGVVDRAAENARRNGVAADPLPIDWTTDVIARTYDRIVAADILYHPSANLSLFRWLAARLNLDGIVWIADPGRVEPAAVASLAADAGLTANVIDLGGGIRLYELRRMAPLAAPRRTTLTIGMAVCDDFDGWYFTTQNIRLNHAEVLDRIEFVVVDNRPDSPEGEAIRRKIRGVDERGEIRSTDGTGWIPNARYVAMAEVEGTSATRARIFDEARTDAVLVLDCHVLIERGALARLLDWFDTHPESRDLLHGPMLDDRLPAVHATHMLPEWGSDLMFGRWAVDPELCDPDATAKEIAMHGLGLFACLKSAWPGFPPHLAGFGGEEGNLHHAIRMQGGRVWCLPFLRWLHRFDRPRFADERPYDCWLDDKCRNYLIWNRWLGKPLGDVVERFKQKPHLDAETNGRRLPPRTVEAILREVQSLPIEPLRAVAPPAIAQSRDDAPACVHRGELLYQRHCPPCKSRTGRAEWVDVFACAEKRRCTLESTGLAIAGCNTCDQRRPPEPALIRLGKMSGRIVARVTGYLFDVDLDDGRRVSASALAACQTCEPGELVGQRVIVRQLQPAPADPRDYHSSTTYFDVVAWEGPAAETIAGLVSVLIVTHGRHARLREALACFLSQDHGNRELLILNHHPTPLTLGFDDARIRIFNTPNELTFGANLDALLPHARGEFLTTWGDDDLYLPWCLSMAVSRIGDRPAWKPARSWFWDGVAKTMSQVGNNLEASILWRTEFVRAHGFDAEGDSEAGRLFAALNGPVPSDDVGNDASLLTTWGTGIHHLSGSIGRGTAAERHAAWRKNNQDDGAGVPLTPADVCHWWRRIADTLPPDERDGWTSQCGL